MKKRASLSSLGIPLLLGALLAPSISAQTGESPDDFGTDFASTVIDFHDFVPTDSTGPWGGVNERYSTGDLTAAINMLPDGSILQEVDFFVRDDDSMADFTGRICWNWVDATSGVTGAGSPACSAGVSSSGTPGELRLPPLLPFLQIQHGQDIDTNGTYDIVSYYLLADTGAPDVAIRSVRLTWFRQVSPGPAMATFNDVPTNHPFFQFVEALVASGVTAGCGSGNYCPDAPLTRGQMAVFLAKALGLHWPQ